MDWSPHVPAVSPPFPFIHEVTGDSDDACDRIVTIASGSGTAYPCINVAAAVDVDVVVDDGGDGDDGGDDDDARSCSYESWRIMGDAKIRHRKKKEDDDDDHDNGGTEYDWSGYGCRDYQFAHRERGIPDIILDSTPMDQEALESSYEVVKGENDMRRMEDKLFWETCLAIGYP
ncbi:hypothetical protein AAC387_Pa10g1116 [Persea americana]|eukprot:TRINITY_DN29390_c0_g1_i1.p1 TRINITY_DN29390_c0_g1~~TRINITY_DN29390_c0_g1_i1.p1  ORF type:complete len:174 (-),score=45.84 TRINITY_DN29390_c0_g1_i1:137-658(-)